MPVGDLTACISLLERSSHTLTDLSLTDHFFGSWTKGSTTPPDQAADVEKVLRSFADNAFQLRSLQIGVQSMDDGYLENLSNKLTGLRTLVVVFKQSLVVTAGTIITMTFQANRRSASSDPKDFNWPRMGQYSFSANGPLSYSPKYGSLGVATFSMKANLGIGNVIAERVAHRSLKLHAGIWCYRRVFED